MRELLGLNSMETSRNNKDDDGEFEKVKDIILNEISNSTAVMKEETGILFYFNLKLNIMIYRGFASTSCPKQQNIG